VLAAVFVGPNDQNSDRGIETNPSSSTPTCGVLVRTTRIPTEELKLVETTGRGSVHGLGPNDQNSDRGIETILTL